MQHISRLLRKTTVAGRPPSIRSPGSSPLPSAEELAAFGRREAGAIAAERRQAAQVALERAVGRAGIPRRFRGRDFDAYRAVLAEQRTALAVCRGYAERFAQAAANGCCLLLVGAHGTGKTHLACAILSAAIRAGYTGLFISVSEALRTIRDAYSPRAVRSESQAFALLAAPDLLVLDEVGVAIGDAEKRKAMLFDVLNARYADRRPSVLIGNLTAAELEAYLGERIMDRLLESGSAVVPFTWESYRRQVPRPPQDAAHGRGMPAKTTSFHVHDLRHTCAAWLVQAGVPLPEIRDLLRHSTIKVTERYAHLSPHNVREAVNRLSRHTERVTLTMIDEGRTKKRAATR